MVVIKAWFCAAIDAGSLPSGNEITTSDFPALPAATNWLSLAMNGSRSGGQKHGMGASCKPWQLPGCLADGVPRWTPKLGMRARLMSRRTIERGAAVTIATSASSAKECCITNMDVIK